jgi:hypothetical protein
MPKVIDTTTGGYLMKSILTIAGLCCLALCFAAIAEDAAELTTLRQDSQTNYSLMNLSLFSSLYDLGVLDAGEAVKFTAPKPGWKLQKVNVVGWSGYNETTETFAADRNVLLEVRDADLRLLYKFADAQNNYFLSRTGPVVGEFEIPAVAVTGDFYVVFYDRGAAKIVMENYNGTGNSFIYSGGELIPAEFTDPETNETNSVNWLIEAAGN